MKRICVVEANCLNEGISFVCRFLFAEIPQLKNCIKHKQAFPVTWFDPSVRTARVCYWSQLRHCWNIVVFGSGRITDEWNFCVVPWQLSRQLYNTIWSGSSLIYAIFKTSSNAHPSAETMTDCDINPAMRQLYFFFKLRLERSR